MPQPGMGGGGSPNAPSVSGGSGSYYAPPDEFNSAALNYADAQDAYKRALIRFNAQRGGLLRQYGYAGDIDPTTGMVKNLRVDAGNSYGLLQQLLHNQALEDTSAENAAQERGLVGGLAHQAEGELRYQHHGQSSDLANTLLGNLGDLNSQQLDAKHTLDMALYQLQHQAAQEAINNGEFNPADLTDLTDGSGGGGGASGGGSKSKAKAMSMVGSIPSTIASSIVKRAIAKGEPVSEHGLGQMKSPSRPATKKPAPKRAPANAYTSGKKKRG